MRFSGGASAASLTSLTSIFFSPVWRSTNHSSPCSPELSRWTNETLVLSGLHFTVSGSRPVIPPSAKMASMVSGCLVDCAGARAVNSSRQIQQAMTRVRLMDNCERFGYRFGSLVPQDPAIVACCDVATIPLRRLERHTRASAIF